MQVAFQSLQFTFCPDCLVDEAWWVWSRIFPRIFPDVEAEESLFQPKNKVFVPKLNALRKNAISLLFFSDIFSR